MNNSFMMRMVSQMQFKVYRAIHMIQINMSGISSLTIITFGLTNAIKLKDKVEMRYFYILKTQ